MNKKLFFLSMILMFTGSKAQIDTINPSFRFSGVQVGLNGITTFFGTSLDRQQTMKYVTDDLLYTNLNEYSSFANNTLIEYNASFGFRLFATAIKKRKYELDLFLGMCFGSSRSNSQTYFKTIWDTTNTFLGTNGGKLYEVRQNNSIYSFNVSSQQILMPVGFNYTTSKQNRFWASWGVELTPGIRTNYQYLGTNFLVSTKHIVDPNTMQGMGPGETTYKEIAFSYKKIKQVGFAGYISVPVGVNMRLSKRTQFLKHMNASASVAPAYYMSYDKITKFQQSFAMTTNFGLRYNL